jgi:hypothetical protein
MSSFYETKSKQLHDPYLMIFLEILLHSDDQTNNLD